MGAAKDTAPTTSTTPTDNNAQPPPSSSSSPLFSAARRPKLPPTLIDRITEFLPDWITDNFRSRQRQLLVLERKMQRTFINEYKQQLRNVEPVLRQRGVIIGEVIIEAFTSADKHQAKMTYSDALAKSVAESPIESGDVEGVNKMQRLPLPELVSTLDPLLTPVLSPFVEGLKQPINAHIGDIEKEVKAKVIAACAACAVVGFVAGRMSGGKRQ